MQALRTPCHTEGAGSGRSLGRPRRAGPRAHVHTPPRRRTAQDRTGRENARKTHRCRTRSSLARSRSAGSSEAHRDRSSTCTAPSSPPTGSRCVSEGRRPWRGEEPRASITVRGTSGRPRAARSPESGSPIADAVAPRVRGGREGKGSRAEASAVHIERTPHPLRSRRGARAAAHLIRVPHDLIAVRRVQGRDERPVCASGEGAHEARKASASEQSTSTAPRPRRRTATNAGPGAWGRCDRPADPTHHSPSVRTCCIFGVRVREQMQA